MNDRVQPILPEQRIRLTSVSGHWVYRSRSDSARAIHPMIIMRAVSNEGNRYTYFHRVTFVGAVRNPNVIASACDGDVEEFQLHSVER